MDVTEGRKRKGQLWFVGGKTSLQAVWGRQTGREVVSVRNLMPGRTHKWQRIYKAAVQERDNKTWEEWQRKAREDREARQKKLGC